MAILTKHDYLQLSFHLINKPVYGALHQWPSLVWNLADSGSNELRLLCVCATCPKSAYSCNAITNQIECCKQLIPIQQ